jgi:hypothetical protein
MAVANEPRSALSCDGDDAVSFRGDAPGALHPAPPPASMHHMTDHWTEPPDDLEDADAAFLDDEFPLGDGVADVDGTVHCPYCGEPNEIALDPGGGSHQEYVEDCQVCCRPWRVGVSWLADGGAEVSVEAEQLD